MHVVVESVKPSDESVSLIIGCSKLKTNKLSMRPDPYVRIYRCLDAPESSGDDGMPDRCPVYASNYVRNTREASWSTTPIAKALLMNSNPESRLMIEVWDFQFNAEDRLIGFVELTARYVTAYRPQDRATTRPIERTPRARTKKTGARTQSTRCHCCSRRALGFSLEQPAPNQRKRRRPQGPGQADVRQGP